MNLHGIVSAAIGAVNPFIPATLQVSTGSTTAADGSRTPTYADPVTVSIQVQALSYGELQQLEGLNIQGDARAVYLAGSADGVSRPDGKGGDLLTFNGERWLVSQALETWPDWCKLLVVRQL